MGKTTKTGTYFTHKERGNVFFALFGAVAVVGVIGAASMSIMRGPLTTMVEVNKRTQAESQMQIAAKMAVIEAVENLSGEDCDADGAIEPIHARSGTTVPANGGLIPNSFGINKTDPWGTEYGYCVWDAGVDNSNAACDEGVGEEPLLDGEGTADDDYTVIAIISAGPDRTFNTTCNTFAAADANSNGDIDGSEKLAGKVAGSDDIIIEATYAEASTFAGGLWTIKSGDPATATTTRQVEVTQDARFGGQVDLDLLGGSLILPNEINSGACNAANDGVVRRNTTTTPPTVEICDFAGGAGWVSVAAGATTVSTLNDGDSNINVDDGVPEIAFTIDGTVEATIDATDLDAGSLNISTTGTLDAGDTTITGTVTVTGDVNLGDNATDTVNITAALDVNGDADFSGDVVTHGNTTLGDDALADSVTITATLNGQGDADFDGALDVQGNVVLGDDAADTVNITGLLTADEDVDFNADLNVDGVVAINNSGTADPALNVTGNIDLSGDVDGDNATFTTVTIDGTGTSLDVTNNGEFGGYVEADDFFWQGNNIGPSTCSVGEYSWWDGNSWECAVDDDGSGSSGDPTDELQDIEEVLNRGSDANGEGVENLGPVAIGGASVDGGLELDVTGEIGADDYCNSSGAQCFTTDEMNQSISEVLGVGNDAGGTTDLLNLSGLALGSSTISDSVNLDVLIDVTGDVAAIEFCDQNGANCFDAASVAALVGGAVTEIDDLTDASTSYGAGNNIFMGDSTGGSFGASDINNTAIGVLSQNALNNSASTENVSVGNLTLTSNTGDNNVAVGVRALNANTSGTGNVAVGRNAMINNQDGGGNVAIGLGALSRNVSESSNVAVGNAAGFYNVGNSNTFLGTRAGTGADGISTAFRNVLLGYQAGNAIEAGNNNTIVGHEAGLLLTDGSDNTFLGRNAGDLTTTGTDNIIIGVYADASSATASNELNIGGTIFGNLSAGRVGIGVADATAINASALLQLDSTVRGFLMPRMTTAERDNIVGPATGLQVYNTSTSTVDYFDGANWVSFASTAGNTNTLIDADSDTSIEVDTAGDGSANTTIFTNNGAESMRIDAAGNLGLGTPTPTEKITILDGNIAIREDDNGNTAVEMGAGTQTGFIALLNDGTLNTVIRSAITADTYFNAGNVVFGNTAADPSARVQVDSTTQGFLPPRVADPVNDVAAPATGLIAYDSTDNELQVYDGTSWVAFSGDSSGLWTDNTTHITRENFHILDSGLAAGSTTAGLDGDGTYVFYNPDKGAFRGGEIASADDAWQDANIALNSFAWGYNAEASGIGSVALGYNTTASGFVGTAMGGNTTADGSYSFAAGENSVASGSYSVALGRNSTASAIRSVAIMGGTASGGNGFAVGSSVASGSNSVAIGPSNITSGGRAFTFGYVNVASGADSGARGRYTTASGYASHAFGTEVQVGDGTAQSIGNTALKGNYSMAFGLGDASTATFPQVTGNKSAAFFLGDQESTNVTSEEIFAILGESLIVNDGGAGTTVTATASAIADFNSTDKGFLPPRIADPAGDVAAPATGLIAYDSTDNELQVYDGTSWVTFSGGGAGDADWQIDSINNYVYNTTDSIGIGTATPISILDIVGDNQDVYHTSTASGGGSANYGADYIFRRSVGGAVVVDDYKLGGVRFQGYDGNDFRLGGAISAQVDGTPGVNDMPTRLEFHVAADGEIVDQSSDTPEMVIKNGGNVGINQSDPQTRLHVGGSLLISDNGHQPTINLLADANNNQTGVVPRFRILNDAYNSANTVASLAYTETEDLLRLNRGEYNGDDLVIDSGGRVALNTTTIDSSAQLQIDSTIRGFLPPRVADPVNDIAAPATGLIAYDSMDNELQVYDGTSWVTFSGGGAAADADWQIDAGNGFVYNTTDKIGIGTATPLFDLQVQKDQDAATYNGVVNMDAGSNAGASLAVVSDAGNTLLGQTSIAGSGAGILINDTATGLLIASEHATGGGLSFQTGPAPATERMRITKDGFIGIGTATPISILDIVGDNQDVYHTSTASGGGSANYGADYIFRRSVGGAIVVDGYKLGGVRFQGYDGNDFRLGGAIAAQVDGTPGSGDMPTRLEFHVAADGEIVDQDADVPEMVIKNDGKVGIGTATPNGLLEISGAGMIDSDRLLSIIEDGDTLFSVTARNGGSIAHGPSRDFSVCLIGGSCLGIDNQGLAARDHLGVRIRAREDEGAADHAISLINDVLMPAGVPLLKVGIGTDAATAEYLRVDSTGGVGIGTGAENDASALMEISSTSRGFLPPRISDPVNDIAAPATGLIAYDSTDNELQVYDGTSWVTFSGGGAAAIAINDLTDAFNDPTTDFDNNAMDDDDNMFIGHVGASLAATPVPKGVKNIGVGTTALSSITTGYENTAMGYNAARDLTTSISGVFIGSQAGEQVTTGNSNVFIGNRSGWTAADSNANVAVGDNALGLIGWGGSPGSANVAMGYRVARSLQDGYSNIVIGSEAAESGNSFDENVIIGGHAATDMTTAVGNTIIGHDSGDTLTDGTNNILIGYNIDASGASVSNELNIGNTLYGDLSQGFIGIGGPSPSDHLTIIDNAANPVATVRYEGVDQYSAGTMRLSVTQDVADNKTGQLIFSSNTDGYNSSIEAWTDAVDATGMELRFYTDANGVGPGPVERMRLDGDGGVSIGPAAKANASSILELTSTTRGFLPPRIADPVNDVAAPAAGLIAYDSTDNELQVYDGTSWVTFSGGGAAAIAINDLTDAYADADSIILGNGTPAGATQDTVLGMTAHVNAGADSYSNVVIGWEAGGGMNAAESDGQMTTNTVVGARAGGRIGRNADGNVLFGYAAGAQMAQDADNNVVIGTGAGAFIDDDDNNILIGDGVTVHTNWTTSNHLNIGNTVFADMTNAATGDAGAARVGINSATPDSALEINYAGTASDDIPVDLATITLRNTTAQGGAAIQLFEVNSQQGFEIENYSSVDASENYLSFKSYPNSPNPIEFLRVQRDNQEVQFRNLTVGGPASYVSQLRLMENVDASEDGVIFEYDGANNIFHMKSGFGGTYPEIMTVERDVRSVAFGTAGVAAAASAQLEIASTTKGFLPPRIADPAGDVTAPATGLIAYDSTDNELQVYDGTSWVTFSGGGAGDEIRDADNDTKIQVEESADEDIIRFDIASNEVMRLRRHSTLDQATTLEINSSVSTGFDARILFKQSAGGSSFGSVGYLGSLDTFSLNGDTKDVTLRANSIEGLRLNNAGQIGIGTGATIDSSSVLQVDSSDKGFLPPRIADPAADITTPATGLIAYDSTDNELQVYDGASWVTFSGGGAGAIAINDLTDAATDYATDFNIFMGSGTGANIAAGGQYNMTIGIDAGTALTTGDGNVALGYQALNAGQDNQQSVAVGYRAAASSNNTHRLVAVGGHAAENFDGDNWHSIVAVGHQAAQTLTAGSGITAIGNEALQSFSGNDNTAVGNLAMFTTNGGGGNENTAVGAYTGGYMAGSGNVLFGHEAFKGGFSGDYDHGGDDNVLIGRSSARDVTGSSTSQNTFIGSQTGLSLRDGADNILIGYNTDVTSSTSSNELNIGNTIFGDLANGYVGIGTATPAHDLHMVNEDAYTTFVQDTFSDTNILHHPVMRMRRARGTQAAPTAVQNNSVLGTLSYAAYDGDSYDPAAAMVAVVDGAPADESSPTSIRFLTDDGTTYTERMRIAPDGSVRIGPLGAVEASAVFDAVSTTKGFLPPRVADPVNDITTPATGLIAYDSTDNELQVYDGTSWVTFSGGGAGAIAINDLTDAKSDVSSVFLGNGAGAVDNGNNRNTAVGVSTMAAIDGGEYNTAIGHLAMTATDEGDSNVAIGYNSMAANVDRSKNVAIGAGTMEAATNSNTNIAIGFEAMSTTTSGGTGNVAIGENALDNVEGDSNIAIGAGTGTTLANGNNNILIGDSVNASGATVSNELNIGGTVFGDLANKRVGIGVTDASSIAAGSTLHVLSPDANADSALLVQSDGTAETGVGMRLSSVGTTLAEITAYRQTGGTQHSSLVFNTRSSGSHAERMRIHENGYVGIGTATPSNLLELLGGSFVLREDDDGNIAVEIASDNSSGWIELKNNNSNTVFVSSNPSSDTYFNAGNIGIGTTTPSVELDVVGDIEYTGTITDVSDRRLKTDIHKLNTDDVIAKLAQIDTYSFKMKGDETGRTEFGVMAQDLEKLFPELVKTADDEMGTKSVNYVGLIAPMIEVTKALKSENDALKAELASMKSQQVEVLAALKDMKEDVAGIKLHTNYGIQKAAYESLPMMIMMMLFGGAFVYMVMGIRRKPQ